MSKLFTGMVKEEWRIHSTVFGSLSFALFPVMIFGIAFMGTFLIPLFRTVVPAGDLATIIHAIFLLLGIMVGAFGLIGMEAMNRRFGQASLIAYSARSLPISERTIYLNFVVKDTVYYFFLWVFPFVAGFALASMIIGIPAMVPLILLLTLTLSFLTGLSLVFFLSTAYTRSRVAVAALVVIFVATPFLLGMAGMTIVNAYPPLALFHSFSWPMLLIALGVVIIPFIIAVGVFSAEYSEKVQIYPASLTTMAKRLSVFPYPPLAAKDLLDILRSGSLVGQTLFSFLIPLGLLWFLLSALSRILPNGGTLLLFAILTGVIGSTIYTWITSFDTFSSYLTLPIGVTTLLTSKICSFSVLQIIPALFIILVSIISGQALFAVPALVLCLSVSFYSLAVTVWLTGLSPSILVYDAKVLMSYLVLVGIVVLIAIGVSFANPFYAIGTVLFLLPAWGLIWQSYRKWEDSEQPSF